MSGFRIPETEAADEEFGTALASCSLRANERDAVDESEGKALLAYEMQGFINGFRLGSILAHELNFDRRREESA